MDSYESHRLEERRLRFGTNRHMSTLSVAVLMLMLALDQRFEGSASFSGSELQIASLCFPMLFFTRFMRIVGSSYPLSSHGRRRIIVENILDLCTDPTLISDYILSIDILQTDPYPKGCHIGAGTSRSTHLTLPIT